MVGNQMYVYPQAAGQAPFNEYTIFTFYLQYMRES